MAKDWAVCLCGAVDDSEYDGLEVGVWRTEWEGDGGFEGGTGEEEREVSREAEGVGILRNLLAA